MESAASVKKLLPALRFAAPSFLQLARAACPLAVQTRKEILSCPPRRQSPPAFLRGAPSKVSARPPNRNPTNRGERFENARAVCPCAHPAPKDNCKINYCPP